MISNHDHVIAGARPGYDLMKNGTTMEAVGYDATHMLFLSVTG